MRKNLYKKNRSLNWKKWLTFLGSLIIKQFFSRNNNFFSRILVRYTVVYYIMKIKRSETKRNLTLIINIFIHYQLFIVLNFMCILVEIPLRCVFLYLTYLALMTKVYQLITLFCNIAIDILSFPFHHNLLSSISLQLHNLQICVHILDDVEALVAHVDE